MHQSKPYRKCVGLVIINKDNKIFVGKRIDSNLNAWQMPQGVLNQEKILMSPA